MNILSQERISNTVDKTIESRYAELQANLLWISVFNFFVLALVGLLLRAYPIFQLSFLSYKYLLHAHSHFAFGGWITPVLMFLILKFFPELQTASAYRHWRNSIVLMLTGAYGMLLSFPFQGYGAVSIIFSTLSIGAGSYAAVLSWSIIRRPKTISQSFLIASFLYFFLAALGPFATGPLIVMGKAGTPIYFNAIYFYLHFQYNGFFSFVLFAVLYKMIEARGSAHNGRKVFWILNLSCLPAYFLSVLWTKPAFIFYLLGGAAAAVQLAAVILLLKDLTGFGWKHNIQGWLLRLSIIAFVAKCIFQLASAFPAIANLAYQNRNFIIAYLHLVLIGFISLFVFGVIVESWKRIMRVGVFIFLLGFVTTELLLVLQAAGFIQFLSPMVYLRLLFGFSSLFPISLLIVLVSIPRKSALEFPINPYA